MRTVMLLRQFISSLFGLKMLTSKELKNDEPGDHLLVFFSSDLSRSPHNRGMNQD